jgi:amino-acid N-acetyltransferase
MSVTLRAAAPSDAAAIHSLVAANLEAGICCRGSIEDIRDHVARFFVAEREVRGRGCAELARLSSTVAEVRSLVVDESLRGQKIGTRLVAHLLRTRRRPGYSTLCAFTHAPGHFVRLGSRSCRTSGLPEKIAHDCNGCALFRRCGQ